MLVVLNAAAAVQGAASSLADVVGQANGIIWAAAVCAAIAGIYRFLHLGEIARGTLNFLRDYNGEPARPGVEARPGLPDRIAKIESQTHEIKGRDAQLVVALEELSGWAKDNGVKIDRLDERVIGLDERVTDHRRRNDAQAAILRTELERRANELEQQLRERNSSLDARLDRMSDDLLRAEAMRAALTELGLDIEPPKKKQ